jgi:hypothetical protein
MTDVTTGYRRSEPRRHLCDTRCCCCCDPGKLSRDLGEHDKIDAAMYRTPRAPTSVLPNAKAIDFTLRSSLPAVALVCGSESRDAVQYLALSAAITNRVPFVPVDSSVEPRRSGMESLRYAYLIGTLVMVFSTFPRYPDSEPGFVGRCR